MIGGVTELFEPSTTQDALRIIIPGTFITSFSMGANITARLIQGKLNRTFQNNTE
jgi:hypothetical protein